MEDRNMAIYIMLSSITDQGAEIIKRKPHRIKEVNAEIVLLAGDIEATIASVPK